MSQVVQDLFSHPTRWAYNAILDRPSPRIIAGTYLQPKADVQSVQVAAQGGRTTRCRRLYPSYNAMSGPRNLMMALLGAVRRLGGWAGNWIPPFLYPWPFSM